MTTQIKPYPRYRPSGIEWLGVVPEHWEVKKLKHLGEAIIGLTYDPSNVVFEDQGLLVLRASNVSGGKIILNDNVYVDAEIPKDLITMVGDILLCSRSGSRALIGKCALIDEHSKGLTFGAFMTTFRSKYNLYLYFVFSSKLFESQTAMFFTSTINQLTTGDLKNMIVPLPPENELSNIEKFLNQTITKLDDLIAQKQRLIELLKEKRMALVHEANQSHETQKMRLKHLTNEMIRPVNRNDEDEFVPIGLYNWGRGIFHKETTLGKNLGDSDFFWVKSEDLILSGQFAWEGAVALASDNEDGCVASHRYPILQGKPGLLDTAYLYAFLTTKTGNYLLNEHSRGSAGRNRPLNLGTLMKEKIPFPSMEAQLRISEHVHYERWFGKIVKKSIELISEYRKSIITDVITGKIDLREWKSA